MRRYPPSDTSVPAQYARAIAAYRNGNSQTGLKILDGLLKAQPKNPYFWELQGQINLENGRAGQAVPGFRKAVSLAPKSGMLKVLLGQALVETGDPSVTSEAIKNLTVGLQVDPNMAIGYRSLARAYAARGDIALADLATAQGEFAGGNYAAARQHAARAQKGLKPGSPGWIRADDIVSYHPDKPG